MKKIIALALLTLSASTAHADFTCSVSALKRTDGTSDLYGEFFPTSRIFSVDTGRAASGSSSGHGFMLLKSGAEVDIDHSIQSKAENEGRATFNFVLYDSRGYRTIEKIVHAGPGVKQVKISGGEYLVTSICSAENLSQKIN